MWLVVREKSVYHTLNMFKPDYQGMLRGEGWVVASAFNKARATINEAHSRYESAMPCLVEDVSRQLTDTDPK
jgi:V-type H+-transporting ATPase subunit a